MTSVTSKWDLQNNTSESRYKTETDTGMENKLSVTNGEERTGKDQLGA